MVAGMRLTRLPVAIAMWVVLLAAAIASSAQRRVTFPLVSGSGMVSGDLYGSGAGSERGGLVLAHGGRFDETSWKPEAEEFARAGFLVLAVRFRGDGLNPDGSPSANGPDADNAADVLAAAAYLRKAGVKTVDAIGGSLGGDAVGDADAKSPGTFDRMVFLGSEGGDAPEKLTGRKLYLVADDDRSADGLRLPGIEAHYKRAPEPKKLVPVPGMAHAQYLFGTDEGPKVMKAIMDFLTAN